MLAAVSNSELDTLILVVCLVALALAAWAAWQTRIDAAVVLTIIALVVGVVFL